MSSLKLISAFIAIITIISIPSIGQTVEVTIGEGELYSKAHRLGTKTKIRNPSNRNIIYAYSPGYITQVLSETEICDLQKSAYQFDLKPITLPDTSFKSKKIRLTRIVDKTSKSGIYVKSNLEDQEEIDAIQGFVLKPLRQHFRDANYNIIDLDFDLFNKDERGIRFLVSGEILDYDHETKGTSGYKINVQVKWTVIDNRSHEEALTLTTGGYSDTGSPISRSDELDFALKDALNGLLCSHEFQDIVSVTAPDAIVTYKGFELPEEFKKNPNSKISNRMYIHSDNGDFLGSFISDDGYLLCAKVDSHALKPYVTLSNGIELPVRWVTTDDENELSLLKINANGVPNLELDFSGTQLEESEVSTIILDDMNRNKKISAQLKDSGTSFAMHTPDKSIPLASPVLNEDEVVIGFTTSNEGQVIAISSILKNLNITQKD